MPNPYYIPQNPLAVPTQQAMQLLQLKQQAGLSQKELGMRERSLGETQRANMAREGLTQQQIGIEEKKLPYYERPIDQGRWSMFNVQIKNRKLDKAMEPLTNFIKGVTGKEGSTPLDLYMGLQRNLPMLSPQIKMSLEKELQKAVKDQDVSRQQEITGWINAISDPKTIDSFFPGVKEALTPTKTATVPEGGTLVDTRTGEVLARGRPTLPKDFNTMLGKLQAIRDKKARLELGLTEMGFPFPENTNTEAARKIYDREEQNQIKLMKKHFPQAYKDYAGEETIQGGVKTTQGQKALDKATAMKILQQAGGDKDKARELAKKMGYSF